VYRLVVGRLGLAVGAAVTFDTARRSGTSVRASGAGDRPQLNCLLTARRCTEADRVPQELCLRLVIIAV